MTYPAFDLDDITSEFLAPDASEEAEEFTEQELPSPDAEFVEQKKETPRAKRYRLKVKHGLNFLMANLAGNPSTVADAAAIIEHGPGVAKAVGELADYDEKVRKAIDFVTDGGIDNPYILTVFALIPLVFQVIRNHEHQIPEQVQVGFRIPFTKRRVKLPIRFRLRLMIVHRTTAPPITLTEHIFGNQAIREALEKRDIKIAWQPNYSNGHRPQYRERGYVNGTASR